MDSVKNNSNTPNKVNHYTKMYLYGIGLFLRFFILKKLDFFEDRPEISNPLNSLKRVREGLTLSSYGISPTDGDIVHVSPLILYFFSLFGYDDILFILFDMGTAFLLDCISKDFRHFFLEDKAPKITDDVFSSRSSLFELETQMSTWNLGLFYLFNPLILANLGGRTLTVFSNYLTALFLYSLLKRKSNICTFAVLTLLMTFDLYSIVLLAPSLLFLSKSSSIDISSLCSSLLSSLLLLFLLFLSLLLSYILSGNSFNFLRSTFVFTLTVPEYTPNMGLFWYFFTEMFEHFRSFFVFSFQINSLLYVCPLTLKLKDHPSLLLFSLLALNSIFKSYPSYGDVGLYLCLLPAFSRLFPYMKQSFVIAILLLVALTLSPLLYGLWMINGSANANYYFAMNLIFNVSQIFLLTDLLFAHIKREFYWKFGFPLESESKTLLTFE